MAFIKLAEIDSPRSFPREKPKNYVNILLCAVVATLHFAVSERVNFMWKTLFQQINKTDSSEETIGAD
jgi:hypothetical protein